MAPSRGKIIGIALGSCGPTAPERVMSRGIAMGISNMIVPHDDPMMVAISVIHINIAEDKSLHPKAEALWAFIEDRDERLYLTLHRSFLNLCISLAKKTGRRVSTQGLKLAKRIYKFS